MKKIIMAALLLASVTAFANNANNNSVLNKLNVTYRNAVTVPAPVLASFNAMYPTATNVVWQKEDHNRYSAEFFLGPQQWRAIYKADGTFVSSRKIK